MMKQTITETLMKVFNLEPPPSDNVIDLLKEDHRKVEQLFKDFEKAEAKDEKLAILKEVITELNLHSAAEEKLVYSTLKDGEEEKVEEAFEEHHLAKFLLAELDQFDGSEENFDAKVKALSEVIKHHVKEEELDMLPKLRGSDTDLEELGREFLEEKEELRANPPSLDLEKFSQNVSEEEEMEEKVAPVHSRKVVQRGRKAKDLMAKASATKKAGKTASSKRPTTKSAAKKAAPGSSATKTKATKKSVAKKGGVKKPASKKSAAKKTAAKVAPKKSATKKAATKTTPKKSATKGSAAKKAAPKKSATKKSALKKSVAGKAAPKKTTAKASAKKPAPKKSAAKKSTATKKSPPKKVGAKAAAKPTSRKSSSGAKTKTATAAKKKAAGKKAPAVKKAASKKKPASKAK